VPMRARRMRLEHAPAEDVAWLRSTLDRISRHFGTRVEREPDGTLAVPR
jgi:poly-gamma-glutamate capsule biosynthesis protein CapA/YwtB (metallophosphatase superfamily)